MLLSTHLFTTIFTAIIYNISEYIYSEIFTSYSHYGYNGKIIAEDIGTGPSLLAISQSRSSIPTINQSATSHRSRVSKFTNHTAAPFTKRMCINIIAIPNWWPNFLHGYSTVTSLSVRDVIKSLVTSHDEKYSSNYSSSLDQDIWVTLPPEKVSCIKYMSNNTYRRQSKSFLFN